MSFFRRVFIFLLSAWFINFYLFSFETISTSTLLLSYLENDNDLQDSIIEAQKAKLSYDSTKIENGFDITLSTGKIKINSKTQTDGTTNTTFSIEPEATATIPNLSNLSLTVSSDISVSGETKEVSNSSISASVDIIGDASITRKISLMKAKRTYTEAKRKMQNQAISAEKTFYSELKNILNSTNEIISAQSDLYSDKIDFETIKAKGYSLSSSTYRLSQMKVLSDEHDIESQTRTLIHDYVVFYKKCGYDITLEEKFDFYDLIPSDITFVEPLNIHNFNPDLYAETENALWTYEYNSLSRKTGKFFTLSANGGYTIKNSDTNSNTVDIGISSKIGGVNLSAGVSVPTQKTSPSYTFSASVNPNTFRKSSITEQQNSLNEQQELLAIDSARLEFETKVVDYDQSLEDLQWTKKTNDESYEMYSTLEKDLLNYYKQGLITESEYLSAQTNARQYAVKKIINAIDFIIYNDEIITMFVDENSKETENQN